MSGPIWRAEHSHPVGMWRSDCPGCAAQVREAVDEQDAALVQAAYEQLAEQIVRPRLLTIRGSMTQRDGVFAFADALNTLFEEVTATRALVEELIEKVENPRYVVLAPGEKLVDRRAVRPPGAEATHLDGFDRHRVLPLRAADRRPLARPLASQGRLSVDDCSRLREQIQDLPDCCQACHVDFVWPAAPHMLSDQVEAVQVCCGVALVLADQGWAFRRAA